MKLPAMPKQMSLTPRVQAEIDGVEMGVLPDGTAYLTARGLARLCGLAPSAIIKLDADWENIRSRPRGMVIADLLEQVGYDERDGLYVSAEVNGVTVNAHPDTVCIAILQYYAQEGKQQAIATLGRLANVSLRLFIYKRLGFDPASRVEQSLKIHIERLVMNEIPPTHFSVFEESSSKFTIDAIRRGLPVNDKTVPDISIGQYWAKYWGKQGLEERFGSRTKHPHRFPKSYRQSQAHFKTNIYPIAALGEFRRWLVEDYMPNSFPKYIEGKVDRGGMTALEARDLVVKMLGLKKA